MSSQPSPARRHQSKTARHFTEEQIQFVLDQVRAYQPTSAIWAAFNKRFEGVRHIEQSSIKYIRATYGKDLHSEAPMGMPLDLDNIQSPALGHSNANMVYGSHSGAFEQSSNPFEANSNDNTRPIPEANQQSAYQPYGFNFQAKHGQQFDPSPSLNPVQEYPDLRSSETWHLGAHDDCEFDAQHRHDLAGGVFFPSMMDVEQMVVRARVVVLRERRDNHKAHKQAKMAEGLASMEEIPTDPRLTQITGGY